MKTIKHFVLAFVASLWAAHGVAADRVAPVLPEATTLTPGETYYLYNVGARKFLSLAENNSNDIVFSDNGTEVLVEQADESNYTLQFLYSGKYMYRFTQNGVYTTENGSDVLCNWNIALSDDVYTIQTDESCTSYYDPMQFLGWDGSDYTKVYPNLVYTENAMWKLIDSEEGKHYCAKAALYKALQATDGYGYNVDKYEAIYNNLESTTEELVEASAMLVAGFELTQKLEISDWSDYPILFENDLKKSWSANNNSISINGDGVLRAIFYVDEESTFSYWMNGFTHTDNGYMDVFVDGKQVRQFREYNQMHGNRFFERVAPGKHVIEWNVSAANISLSGIGVERTPTFTVELLEPGSLGTEVLYFVNSLNDVRRLKIVGKMNDDDWARITMMINLYALDLSEAEVTEIPDEQFWKTESWGTPVKWLFFHEVKLPRTLEVIGEKAFSESYISEIEFPDGLREISADAFAETCIKEAILPASVIQIGQKSFNNCPFLEHISLSERIKTIPESAFSSCCILSDTVQLPSKLEVIEKNAFSGSPLVVKGFPETLNEIGESAFSGIKNDSIVLCSDGLMALGNSIFAGCSNLKYVVLPMPCVQVGNIFDNCPSLQTVVLCAATIVDMLSPGNLNLSQVSLKVPSYLVNTYKLDDYWYNAKDIQGFSTAEVQNWRISKPLTLGVRDRFEGTPNMSIVGQGSLKVNGDAAMTFDNFYIETNQNDVDYSAIMLSNCDNLSIQGQYTHGFYVNANKWYFISLPFDITVSEIELPEGMQKAVRYYDGAQRASNGTGNNWKDYAEDDVIPAGTGFILQTNKAGWLEFHAMENEAKQYVVSNKEFAKALAENPSETVANSGWNLVGNPYQTFYNINHLNFTAPITVWNLDYRRYDAYSIIDDEFVLTPNQAFFVQCPEEVASISFPLEGRQVSEEIVSAQVNTRPSFDGHVAASRRLIDLTLSAGEASDRTRVVLNSEATEDYDLSCDASKFMSMDVTVPQLYTIGADGTTYAINERPLSDGRVRLGLYLPQDGVYTLSLKHRAADEARLVDLQTGTETDLLAGDYHFTGEAGQHDGRFELRLQAGEVTGIGAAQSARAEVKAVAGGLEVANATGVVKVYASGGQLVYEGRADGGVLRVSLSAGLYLVQVSGSVEKVVVD